MDQHALDKCQELIGYRFNDPSILSLALTHASVAPTRVESNERLEFLGDSILGLVVCHELYNDPGNMHEGDMTKIKSSVVSRKTCAEMAQQIGLCEALVLGKGMGGSQPLPESVAAAVFEAVVGAVFLDGGLPAARQFLMGPLGPHIRQSKASEHQFNYKSILQQFLQKNFNQRPSYQLLDEKGPDHRKCFEVAVSVNGRQFKAAWGICKKDAEQAAALAALIELHVLEAHEQK
ncbi:MAG: ribonuclease III [Planctomycetaceae bacterium]|nr:ribonuclease III [Planctomycetaceae bacterium]